MPPSQETIRSKTDQLPYAYAEAAGPPVGEKISVCLLTFNHANVIESTLLSVLDQSIEGYELIVSDDCSTDGTWERILDLAAQDRRIRPVRTPRNVGMPGNANFAVAQSKRPYIALLHHDDLYRRDLLEKWAEVLMRHPDVSFVFNPYDVPNAERPYGHRFREERLDGQWFLEKVLFRCWGCPVRGTAMIRRSCWERVGGMCEQFNLVADVDLWMRLSRDAAVGYVPETLIQPREVRPDYYPDIYTGKTWHWPRLIFAYHIHALNRLAYFDLKSFRGQMLWLGFRIKLSIRTARWLFYAVWKKKWNMLASSSESVTPYDLFPLRIVRRILQLLAVRRETNPGSASR